MRLIAYAATICALLSEPAAQAEDAQTPADKLERIYTYYMTAQNCAEKTIAFNPDDLAKLTAAMRPYAQATGMSQEERDEQWELAKKEISSLVTTKESCSNARTELSKIFPGVLPKTSDSPF